MGSIRRRLRLSPEIELSRDRIDITLAAQVAMLMYLGAACVFFSTLVVRFVNVDTTACTVLGALSLVGAVAWFIVFDRAPSWFVYVGMLYGTGIIAAGIQYTNTAKTESVATLLLGVVYAFVFFEHRLALAYLALVCAAEGLLLHIGSSGSFGWVGYWITSASSLAVVGIVVDALRKRLTTALERSETRARTDELTGLANRRQLMVDLEQACSADEPHFLILFDLNGFKRFNDHFGHVEGDALLRRLGIRLSNVLRDDGRAYRLGGDEFCLLVRGDAGAVTPRAVQALSESGGALRVTAAHGTVAIPAEAVNPIDALRAADRRMYDDKHLGRRADAGDRRLPGLTSSR